MTRRIPSSMATQHPDNAHAPFWETDGDGFVGVREEPEECMVCLRDLHIREFMWDWEGKYAEESVIDRLFSSHYAFFKKQALGKDVFLTFRIPNVWQEKGYSLIRALMVILTSEDFAHDLAFKARPLFEVILPMTEKAEQLMYIQDSFQQLAQFKSKTFEHRKNINTDYLEVIPLVEGVEDQTQIKKLLSGYVRLHKKTFRRAPGYIRPFLARSDPALVSGVVANVLANKIALHEIHTFEQKSGIPMHPIIGAGSLIFRGGLSPARVGKFVAEYGGVRTATVQSAFRYDYSRRDVANALRHLDAHLGKSSAREIAPRDLPILRDIIATFSNTYRHTVPKLIADLEPFFEAVPKRRERRQHIGFLSYRRSMGKHSLPRAINFSAALYSLGIPPEFIGLGRSFESLSENAKAVVQKYYINFRDDAIEAGRFINRDNLMMLARSNPSWKLVLQDIRIMETFFGTQFSPKSKSELLHHNLSSQLWLRRSEKEEVQRLIVETGKLRRSLG
jgi:phosphoenolpyruvate carboxylase